MREHKLSFFDERTAPIDAIIIHSSAFAADKAIKTYEQAEVSAHYIIDLNGQIIRLVDEDKRAWHAGKSFWQGRTGLNNNSVGIEVCNLSLGQKAYDKRQIFALLRLCKYLMKKYHINKENVLGHSDIAPSRKADPGACFPWQYLAQHGIGVWYDLRDCQQVKETDEKKLLSAIGYDITDLTAAKWAFCRHYMPQIVPVDEDVRHLIEHPHPDDFPFKDGDYLQILQAVAYKMKKI